MEHWHIAHLDRLELTVFFLVPAAGTLATVSDFCSVLFGGSLWKFAFLVANGSESRAELLLAALTEALAGDGGLGGGADAAAATGVKGFPNTASKSTLVEALGVVELDPNASHPEAVLDLALLLGDGANGSSPKLDLCADAWFFREKGSNESSKLADWIGSLGFDEAPKAAKGSDVTSAAPVTVSENAAKGSS